ncbi:winged helix-turn-helix domain-containing protein [Halorubrum ezzemoulense]|nr:winged helix-turn-helix domain-containing protein [Halorubrum ezzemoulense]
MSSWWEIAHDLHFRQRLVRTRLSVLANAGWITSHDCGDLDDHWSITTWGAGYLDKHVNADLVRPLPALRPSYATRPDWWAGFG